MRRKLYDSRLKRKLTILQTAEAVGLSKGGYKNIESGARNPSINIAFKLETFFNIPISELLAESEEENYFLNGTNL